MKTTSEIEDLLSNFPTYKHLLFRRGFLITNSETIDLSGHPFYGHWHEAGLGEIDGRAVQLYHHQDQAVHTLTEDSTTIALIGHAYNPYSMESDEHSILQHLIARWHQGGVAFWDAVSELTGVHLIVVREPNRMIAVQDCAGLQSCTFGNIDHDALITSHPQLVADLFTLRQDDFTRRLLASRAYHIGNRHLPGNSTPFSELKRLGGNTYADYHLGAFSLHRFFPVTPHSEATTQQEIEQVIDESARILHQSLELITTKWRRPAISLTGGTDSKTTLACASGLYDRFSYFSYHAKPQEVVDANAAHEICDALGLDHTIYPIPENNEEVVDFEPLKAIIDHNTSYYVQLADHEVRKLIHLTRLDAFDVEVKSWASEITRVFLERKYAIRMPRTLTPRHFSIFQTRYFGDRSLLTESDRRYARYMQEIRLREPLHGYEHADLFYWEVRMGAWGASVVNAFDFAHPVTIPFNNRRLVSQFLRIPREMRKSDGAHHAVMAVAEPRIPQLGIEVPNLYFHKYRIFLEKAYFYYRTLRGSRRLDNP